MLRGMELDRVQTGAIGRVGALLATPSRQAWLMGGMLFILAAANGRPFWWSSALPTVLISGWLIASRGANRVLMQAFSRTNAPIFWSLLALTTCTALSAALRMDLETAQTFVLRCAVPLMIYCAAVGLRLRTPDHVVCVLALVFGSAIPLVSGLAAFYRAGGSFELGDLLYARYDVHRMAEYMEVTFGNVGHVGMYALLLAPVTIVAVSTRLLGRISISLGVGWLSVVAVTIVISGSRTACGVGLAVAAVLVVALHKGRTVVALAGVLAVGSIVLLSADMVDEELLIERLVPAMGVKGRDSSIEERVESIGIGWDTFTSHAAVGVGPGQSPLHNPFDVPHQSVVMVASETGLFGGLAFLSLNLVVLLRTIGHARRAKRHEVDRRRLLWVAGPASWLLGGLLGGITFNMNVALLWVGLAYAMLGLYGFEEARPARATRAAHQPPWA